MWNCCPVRHGGSCNPTQSPGWIFPTAVIQSQGRTSTVRGLKCHSLVTGITCHLRKPSRNCASKFLAWKLQYGLETISPPLSHLYVCVSLIKNRLMYFILYVWVCFTYVCVVLHVCSWCPEQLEGSVKSSGAGVRCGCMPLASERGTSVRATSALTLWAISLPTPPHPVLFVRVNGVNMGEVRVRLLAEGLLWVGDCQVGSKDLGSEGESKCWMFLCCPQWVHIPESCSACNFCSYRKCSEGVSCFCLCSIVFVQQWPPELTSWVLYYISVKIAFFVFWVLLRILGE